MNSDSISNNIHVSSHPIVATKISQLRDQATTPKQVRELIRDLGQLIGYEATADLNIRQGKTLNSPLASYSSIELRERVALVPVLRSGLGLVDPMLSLLPEAHVLHLGLYRERSTLQPVEYYNKLPQNPNVDSCIVLDPIIATGGTAVATINILKDWGIEDRNIKFICICASKPGLQLLAEKHPEISVYVGVVDEILNDHGYILPGLGDCGDRLWDTNF
ncbi:uracil phosphoribosyltransferase [Endogone sp. FLAS-F59071]|nr:uracil phosphoribosyltransferase [Endogone sp. FLAS-F59071]|eukprot:RUS19663.1 uracil phosphoribosyltransferase [Endogone sp. FLAS-F59071]